MPTRYEPDRFFFGGTEENQAGIVELVEKRAHGHGLDDVRKVDFLVALYLSHRLTIRWSRPEIQPDLPRVGERSELRAGCSAQSRWAAGNRKENGTHNIKVRK